MATCVTRSIMLRFIYFLLLPFAPFFEVTGTVESKKAVRAEVKQFPGYDDGPMPSKHYAGYITVGDQVYKKHLYYYFATSERNPAEDPVTIYFMGGPGCSGVSGLANLFGPFRVVKNVDYLTIGPKVELNPFSWTKFANVIVVDFPTFAGYSYAEESVEAMIEDTDDWSYLAVNTSEKTSADREINDTETTSDLYNFILEWFSAFSEFVSNPFYMGGTSYGGIYTVAVANEIVKDMEAGKEPHIHFKGYFSGNAAIDIDIEKNAKVPFTHQMGLISDELYEDLVSSCNGKYWNNDDTNCLQHMATFEKLVAGITDSHVLFLPCHKEVEHTIHPYEHESIKLYHSLQEKPEDDIYCFDYNERMSRLFNPQPSREKLHARQEQVTGKWVRCPSYNKYKRDMRSVIQLHRRLIDTGYRAFIYTGDHDMIVPPGASLKWIKMLNYNVTESWRPWLVDQHVSGFMVRYGDKLLFATFRGGGHVVENYVPQQVSVAFERWLAGSNSL